MIAPNCKPKTVDGKCKKCSLWVDSPWRIQHSIVIYHCDGSHSDECRFLEADKPAIEQSNFFNK
jgi:hypothetical protein